MMDVTQWVILGVAISAVLAVYLYTRRNDGPNPWREMGSTDDELPQDDAGQDDANGMDGPDILIDPSVADEWAGFNPGQTLGAEESSGLVVGDVSPARVRQEPRRQAPVVDHTATDATPDEQTQGAAKSEAEQKIVVLHVVGREQAKFAGPKIHAALERCQLMFGMREVYHRIAEVAGKPQSVFSVANMLKPGSLDPDVGAELATPGLVMFMVLPGPVDANKAFQDMLQTAQDLATALGGVVLDDKRLPLTRQAAQYLIDDIAAMERRRRLAGA